MPSPGDIADAPQLGLRAELISLELGRLVMEVTGNARGFLRQAHVHVAQTEHHEVIEGRLNLVIEGKSHLLGPGEAMEVPPDTPHRQLGAGEGVGKVRITVTPAGGTWGFVERLAEMCERGEVNRLGFPKPVAGARLFRDFGDQGRAARPPYAVQRGLAAFVLAAARAAGRVWRPYAFVDEWDVAAPPEAVYAAVSDGRTFTKWWTPVYIEVISDGEPPAVGKESEQHFKGRLPYHLHTYSEIVAMDPPRSVTADVTGDLRGRGTWTVTPAADGARVRFDWEVYADRPLLKALTPLLRPLLRWNHKWAIERAKAGLERFARGLAGSGSAPGE